MDLVKECKSGMVYEVDGVEKHRPSTSVYNGLGGVMWVNPRLYEFKVLAGVRSDSESLLARDFPLIICVLHFLLV